MSSLRLCFIAASLINAFSFLMALLCHILGTRVPICRHFCAKGLALCCYY